MFSPNHCRLSSSGLRRSRTFSPRLSFSRRISFLCWRSVRAPRGRREGSRTRGVPRGDVLEATLLGSNPGKAPPSLRGEPRRGIKPGSHNHGLTEVVTVHGFSLEVRARPTPSGEATRGDSPVGPHVVGAIGAGSRVVSLLVVAGAGLPTGGEIHLLPRLLFRMPGSAGG